MHTLEQGQCTTIVYNIVASVVLKLEIYKVATSVHGALLCISPL